MGQDLFGIFEAFGRWVEALLLPFMARFVAEGSHFAAGLALVLILAALLGIIYIFFWCYLPVLFTIRQRRKVLETTFNGTETPDDRRQRFYEKYDESINPVLSGASYGARNLVSRQWSGAHNLKLALAWSELKETFVESDRGVIQNTERPHEYFQRAVKNPQRFALFAGVFVSFGLLLTFIGIIAVLLKAGCVMNPETSVCPAYAIEVANVERELGTFSEGSANDAETESMAMQSAVVSIVAGAASKFYASIGGLAASILFKLFLNGVASYVRSSLTSLSDAVESGLAFLPEQTIAQRQLENLAEQTQQLKTFNTDFAVNVGDALSAAMQPVTTQLGKIETELSEQRGTITAGVGQAVDKMAGGEIRELGRVLADLRSELSGLSGKMSEGGDAAALQMAKASEQFSALADSLQSKFEGMAENLGQAGAEIQANLSTSANAFGETLEATLKSMNDASEQNNQRLLALGEQMGTLTSDFGARAQASFTAAIEQSSQETRRAAVEAGDQLREALSDAMGGFEKALRDTATEMGGIEKGFARTATAVETHAQKIDIAASATDRAGQSLGSVSDSLGEVTRPLSRSVESLSSVSGQISTALEQFSTRLGNSLDQFAQTAAQMQSTAEAAEGAWDAYESRFDAVDESLGNALNVLSGSIESNAQRMQGYVAEIDRELAKAVQQFAQAVQPLSDLAEQLEDLTADIARKAGTSS